MTLTVLGNASPAWLMALIGDGIIGLTALVIALLVAKKVTLWVWARIEEILCKLDEVV